MSISTTPCYVNSVGSGQTGAGGVGGGGGIGLNGHALLEEMSGIEFESGGGGFGGNPLLPRPTPSPTPKPPPAQQKPKQSVRDCIAAAARKYLGDQAAMGVLAYGAWTGIGMITIVHVLSRGQTVVGFEALHMAENRGRLTAAYGPFVAALGYSARQHVVNYRAYEAAVRDCKSNH